MTGGNIGTDNTGLRYDAPGPPPTATVEHAGPRFGPTPVPPYAGSKLVPATVPPKPVSNRIHHM